MHCNKIKYDSCRISRASATTRLLSECQTQTLEVSISTRYIQTINSISPVKYVVYQYFVDINQEFQARLHHQLDTSMRWLASIKGEVSFEFTIHGKHNESSIEFDFRNTHWKQYPTNYKDVTSAETLLLDNRQRVSKLTFATLDL